jgi:hypothetical protein
MSIPAQCDECEAILVELRSAFAEIDSFPRLRNELRADCAAIIGVLRDKEEDAERVEEIMRKFQFRPGRDTECRTPRIRDAFQKMTDHRLRTGHMALLRK